MTDSPWHGDFDPTDPDLADETCRVCGEPASFAIFMAASGGQDTHVPTMVCKVCEHYVELQSLDSLIARSPDASEATDQLAETLIAHRAQAVEFQLPGYDPHDVWD